MLQWSPEAWDDYKIDGDVLRIVSCKGHYSD